MLTNISKLFTRFATVEGGEGLHEAWVENQFTANALLLSVGPIKSAVAGVTEAQDVWWTNLLSQLNKSFMPLNKEELSELSKLYLKISCWISITDKIICHLDMPVRQCRVRCGGDHLYWDIPYLGKSRGGFQMQRIIRSPPQPNPSLKRLYQLSRVQVI